MEINSKAVRKIRHVILKLGPQRLGGNISYPLSAIGKSTKESGSRWLLVS